MLAGKWENGLSFNLQSIFEFLSPKQRHPDWDKGIFIHAVLVGFPTILYFCLYRGGVPLISVHFFVSTIYLMTSLMLMYEATIAMCRRRAAKGSPLKKRRLDRLALPIKSALGFRGERFASPATPLPKFTFIVAAYLPNEQDIIIETLEHILFNVQRSEEGMELILAYNTPVDLPVEADLKALSQQYPELRLVKVDGSRSKAENINTALKTVTGKLTCVLDADHHPAPDCFVRAWHWISNGYDVVQGRNVVRNHEENLLAQIVTIEFESIYGISHSARSFMVDNAIFGGSNGYWRTEVLQRIGFNPLMLTEDIDASIRTLLNGFRLIHDRSILVTELAPTRFKSFWSQRKRWAQGWMEVTLKYQKRFWRSRHFSVGQKIYWTYLLYFREAYPIIAIQVLPIVFTALLQDGSMSFMHHWYLFLTTVVTIVSGFYQTLATMKVSALKYPKWYFVQYSFLVLFYTTIKNVISAVALYDHLSGRNAWVVTPRDKQKNKDKGKPGVSTGLQAPKPVQATSKMAA